MLWVLCPEFGALSNAFTHTHTHNINKSNMSHTKILENLKIHTQTLEKEPPTERKATFKLQKK